MTPANGLTTSLTAQFDAVPPDWRDLTEAFRHSAAGQALIERIEQRRRAGVIVYPGDVFAALRLTRRDRVRVVILGQDPYHGPGQAHGLAFSVLSGVKVPPSLRNIYKELQRDLSITPPTQGCLNAWAQQGVLLLNTTLTVEDGAPASHAAWGWEVLTDAIINAVAADPGPKVFMLWGAHAQRKRTLIDAHNEGRLSPHLVLQSNHPSPLSASRGPLPFLGNGHFSAAQNFWGDRGEALNWRLPCVF
ncbi:MAG: uracil-DNA glycosylase [Burkholderiales bacterium]|nr:uracil-DNA glycosylase [Burkholderiales bacterium]